MASATAPPQQHSQPSRKGKKAWRKHVDVSQIQEGLENVRQEIINGGIVAEKNSDALFVLDTVGSESIQKAYNKVHKPLKADEILALRSAIPAVDSRKRSRVTDGIIEPNKKRQKGNGVSREVYERLKRIAYGNEIASKIIIKSDEAPDYDPWAPMDDETAQDPRFSYLEKSKAIRAPPTLKEAPISLVNGADSFPAVVEPKSGTSYNPLFQDWSDLVTQEGEKEVEAEKARLKAAEIEKREQERIAATVSDEEKAFQTEDESAWEGFASDYEGIEWLKKRRPERKTPAERNKIKRRKAAERQAKCDLRLKERARQAQAIKEIARRVEHEANLRMIQDQKELPAPAETDDRILRRRRLGKDIVPDRPLELVLPDELQDSLRLLKPEGNLLKDRFRSVLVRGKIETRKPIQQPRRAKRSLTEKWSYKDFKIPN